MLNRIARWLITPRKLAKWTSEALARAINSNDSSIKEKISKYGEAAKCLADAQLLALRWLEDGRIDDNERKEIEDRLETAFDHILKLT